MYNVLMNFIYMGELVAKVCFFFKYIFSAGYSSINKCYNFAKSESHKRSR